jgi:hypothetical protein
MQIADTGRADRRTGSIYTFAGADSQPGKPLEWNTLEITQRLRPKLLRCSRTNGT